MKQKLLALLLTVFLVAGLGLSAVAASPTGVRVSRSTIKMSIGETRQLAATLLPAGADDTEIRWSSANDKVATVDGGVVTGISAGTTTVYASIGGGRSSPCTVIVRGDSIPAKKMEMSLTSMLVETGKTRQLWIRFTPADTTETDVAWSSSSNEVATVNPRGIVSGLTPGTATITATADSGVSAQCVVTVSARGTAAKEVSSTKTSAADSALTATEARSAVREIVLTATQKDSSTATFNRKTTVSAAALRAAAEAAEKSTRDISLRFLTRDGDGKIQGALTFQAKQVKNRSESLYTSVYLDSTEAVAAAKRFDKSFSNRVAVIHCPEQDFGFTAQIAAKIGRKDLKGDNLRFYSYNPAGGEYVPLEVGSPRIDANGYLRFSSSTGGLIVVSDGPLARK